MARSQTSVPWRSRLACLRPGYFRARGPDCRPCRRIVAVTAVGIVATLACLTSGCGSAWRDAGDASERATAMAPASNDSAAALPAGTATERESAEAEAVWQTDYEQALTLAAELNRPVLLRFTAEWCMPCQVMERSVFQDRNVKKAIAKHVIPVTIDIDEERNAAVAKRYRIRGIPTLLLVDATGRELDRGGFMSAEALTKFVQ